MRGGGSADEVDRPQAGPAEAVAAGSECEDAIAAVGDGAGEHAAG